MGWEKGRVIIARGTGARALGLTFNEGEREAQSKYTHSAPCQVMSNSPSHGQYVPIYSNIFSII